MKPPPLVYTIQIKTVPYCAQKEYILEGATWGSQISVRHIAFLSIRKAAIFAQRDASGRDAILRIWAESNSPHDRAIPGDMEWPELTEQEEQFFRLFRELPSSQEYHRGEVFKGATPRIYRDVIAEMEQPGNHPDTTTP